MRYRAGGRQHERSFPHDRKSLANDYAAQVEHEKRAGDYIDPKAGEVTFQAYAERWIAQHHGADNTKLTYQTALKHVAPAIGGLAMRKITREQIRELLLETMPAKGLSQSMVETARTLINAVLGEALRSGRIRANPAKGIRLPAKQVAVVDFTVPTRLQLDTLASGLPADWALTVWLMRGCGLRIGEALAVHERGIGDGSLRISEQVVDKPPRLGPLKSRKPGETREMPLPRYVATRIEDHLKEHGARDGYLFRGRKHAFVKYASYYESFCKQRDKAKLPPEFTPHDLRHVFARVALSNGVPVTDVSRWLGHTSVDLTYRIYSHFVPNAFDRGRDILDREFEDLV